MLLGYNYYWQKAEYWAPGFDLESLDVWADQRNEVDKLGQTDVVILGSSRAHFDINIHLWDSITGVRPLQLAYPGSSPYFPLDDIVNASDFKGLLLVGVSPGLFFTMADSWGAGRGKDFVDHHRERTYAQILNQRVYGLIDPHLAYLQGELSLEKIIERPFIPLRDSIRQPPVWPSMVTMDKSRNIRMIPQMETDTSLQNQQKDIWFNPDPKNRFADSIDVIMEHYTGLAKKFQDRGGRIVFIRGPVDGYYLETESNLYPRESYWDRLIKECECKGYHYADHPETKSMIPPEWSHLNRKDSDLYTRVLIELLQKDKLI